MTGEQTSESHRARLPVLCIVGPTGVGKSDLGVLVASHVNGEVVSADSMQVYQGMDIGTAKLSRSQMQGVPHHLVDIISPKTPFSVADWTRVADEAIAEIHRRGRLPVVVGGTGLYVRSITEDLDFADEPGSAELRRRWQDYVHVHGNQALHKALEAVDPDSAQRLHPNDVRRVIRALEVAERRDAPLSATYDWRSKGGRYQTAQFGLTMNRDALYEVIDSRVDRMMMQGLEDEVVRLLAQGCRRTLTAMQAIGYKEIAAYLNGEMSQSEAVVRIKQASRRYAKRQMSWFRRDARMDWVWREDDGSLLPPDLERVLHTAEELSAGIREAQHE